MLELERRSANVASGLDHTRIVEGLHQFVNHLSLTKLSFASDVLDFDADRIQPSPQAKHVTPAI